MKKSILIFLFSTSIFAFTQNERCQIDEYRKYLKNHNLYRGSTYSPDNSFNSQRLVYNIPVVIHVLYNNDEQNISDNRVFSQIDVLNEDYNNLNQDLNLLPEQFSDIVGSTGFNFCLAQYDLNGQGFNGINRVYTDVVSFQGFNNDMKESNSGGVDAWDTNSYLNIWVCNLSGNSLGFATMPGDVDYIYDGIVIDYEYFGINLDSSSPYNLGRTGTHEVGHYFNLEHTFFAGCSDWDSCDDTPPIASATFGCPSFPQESCGGVTSMTMNFMDYTDDACMNMFTSCQTTIMVNTLLNQRSGLLSNSNQCTTSSNNELSTSNLIYPNLIKDYVKINLYNSSVIFFDLYGRVILNLYVDYPTEFDLTFLDSGYYVMYFPEIQSYEEFIKH